MSNPNVIAVKTGDEIPLRRWPHMDIAAPVTVLPPCADKTGGLWFCVTHQRMFANQLEKDMHISGTATHKMAWVCNEHGAEDPGPQS